MEIPELTTVEGGYIYLMGSLLLVTAVFGIYLLAVSLGLAPGPVKLTGALAPVAGLA